MSRDDRNRSAEVLARKMMQVYKWEVIKRRAVGYARKSGEKAGPWGMFAWWAEQRFTAAVNEQDDAFLAYKEQLVLQKPPKRKG